MSLETALRETPPESEQGAIPGAGLSWSPEQVVWGERVLDADNPGFIQLSYTRVTRDPSWIERLVRRPPGEDRQLLASLRVASDRVELRARPREPEHLEGLPLIDGRRATVARTADLYDVVRVALQLGAQIAHAAPVEAAPDGALSTEGLRFSQGLAPTYRPDGEGWCYVDERGRVAIPGPFEAAEPFAEQRAAVKVGGAWGFVDALGEMRVEARYDRVKPFKRTSDGEVYARVQLSGQRRTSVDLEGRITTRRWEQLVSRWRRVSTPQKLVGVLAIVAVCGLVYGLYGYWQEDACREDFDVEACRAEGIPLSELDWSSAHSADGPLDLSGADLSGAEMRFAKFERANLSGADLSDANLETAWFNGADLSGANLSGASLKKANFEGANLTGATFSGANLMDAKLSGANLTSTHFEDAVLIRVRLYKEPRLDGTRLAGARLRGVRLDDVDLSTAEGLEDADLSGASYNAQTAWPPGFDPTMSGAIGPGAKIEGGKLSQLRLSNKELQGVNLTGSNLTATDLSRADLEGASLVNATLIRVDLRGANLRDAALTGADLKGALYDEETAWPSDFDPTKSGALGPGARLAGAELPGLELSRFTLRDVDLSGANLKGLRANKLNLKSVDLRGADLSNARLRGGSFAGALMEGVNLKGAEYDSMTRWPSGFDPDDHGARDEAWDDE